MMPIRTVKQVRAHYYKNLHKYENKFKYLKHKKDVRKTNEKIIKIFNMEKRIQKPNYIQFVDEKTQKTVLLEENILKILIRTNSLKSREGKILTLNGDESTFKMAAQIRMVELEIKRYNRDEKM